MKSFVKLSLLIGGLVSGSQALALDCRSLSEWSTNAVYLGGNQVQFSNKAYQANWWTQNNNPAQRSGAWQEWRLLGACDGTSGSNQAPRAVANGPYAGQKNSPIAFSSANSSDSDGSIVGYRWDFGDGSSSNQSSPAHSYAQSGNYSVTLFVTDDAGAKHSATTSAVITDPVTGDCNAAQYNAGSGYRAGDLVSNAGGLYKCNIAGWCSSSAAWAYAPGVGAYWNQAWSKASECPTTSNKAPTAIINGPYAGNAGVAVAFSSHGSSDSDGKIAQYNWSFGDGAKSTQGNPSHSYASQGIYQISLMVTDDKGATHTANTMASITGNGQNQAPIAKISAPASTTTGINVQFSSAGSQDTDGTLVSYRWTFGDGASSSQANPAHSFSKNGSYKVTLTVTDNEGASHAASHLLQVGEISSTHGNKVVGYFAEWGVYGRNYHVKNIHTSGSANKLTHIVYAFGNVQNGECKVGDSYAAYDKAYSASESVNGVADTWDSGVLRGNFGQLRRLKAMYPHIKIVWSFGGWTWSGGFGQAAANPQKFADSCYNLIYDPRWADIFDGIDIDWEYPNECGLSCDKSGFDGYRNLMQALRSRFGNKLVTAAIGAGESKINAADYGGASKYLDFYMVMTYDFFGAFAAKGPTAPHSPLYNYAGMPVQGFSSDHGIQVLKSKGVPAEKILLGLGFYGRGWTGVTQAAPGGSATGAAPGTYEAGIEDYKVLKNTCPPTGTIAGTAYAKCGSQWWGYDIPETIDLKMDYVKQQGLGGAFFWELSGDTGNGELIRAIEEGLDN